MGYKNDLQAYILCSAYGFNPPICLGPRKNFALDTGKYEPDHNEDAETRCMVLAHWYNNTNIQVKYNASELVL